MSVLLLHKKILCTLSSLHTVIVQASMSSARALSSNFGKTQAPGQNWEKILHLTSKLGKINDINHNNRSKNYPQNQVIYIVLCQAQLSVLKYHSDMGESHFLS